jgi:hypothetical protein
LRNPDRGTRLPGQIDDDEECCMSRNSSPARHFIALVIIAGLLALLALLEIYVRVISRVSYAVRSHIERVTHDYPVIIGMIWIVIMVSAVATAYCDYKKSRIKSNLIKLIAWLTFLLGMVTYAS